MKEYVIECSNLDEFRLVALHFNNNDCSENAWFKFVLVSNNKIEDFSDDTLDWDEDNLTIVKFNEWKKTTTVCLPDEYVIICDNVNESNIVYKSLYPKGISTTQHHRYIRVNNKIFAGNSNNKKNFPRNIPYVYFRTWEQLSSSSVASNSEGELPNEYVIICITRDQMRHVCHTFNESNDEIYYNILIRRGKIVEAFGAIPSNKFLLSYEKWHNLYFKTDHCSFGTIKPMIEKTLPRHYWVHCKNNGELNKLLLSTGSTKTAVDDPHYMLVRDGKYAHDARSNKEGIQSEIFSFEEWSKLFFKESVIIDCSGGMDQYEFPERFVIGYTSTSQRKRILDAYDYTSNLFYTSSNRVRINNNKVEDSQGGTLWNSVVFYTFEQWYEKKFNKINNKTQTKNEQENNSIVKTDRIVSEVRQGEKPGGAAIRSRARTAAIESRHLGYSASIVQS